MNRNQTPERSRTVRKGSMAIALAVMFACSLFTGITGIARGVGSMYPQLNRVAQPFVCHGDPLTYQQQTFQIGGATYYSTRWHCSIDDVEKEIDANRVFIFAGIIYGFLMFAILCLITYLYWNSSIGPAKNDGLNLW